MPKCGKLFLSKPSYLAKYLIHWPLQELFMYYISMYVAIHFLMVQYTSSIMKL